MSNIEPLNATGNPAVPMYVEEPVEFWMVWTKTGHKPRFMHNTESVAVNEAKRLAALVPGQKFIVLRAFTKIHVPRQSESIEEAA